MENKTMDPEQLLLAEYEQYSESFWRNEEAGERRVTFFTTLTTALITAIVALRTSELKIPTEEVILIATAALSSALVFGIATFLRILQRDRVTDEYKGVLRYLRVHLKRCSGLEEYCLPLKASRKHWLLRGGLATTVALMNCLLVAVLVAVWSPSTEQAWVLVPAAVLTCFFAHARGINARKNEEAPSQTFRAGAGAVIRNNAGNVLALERTDRRNAWQMPQGGLQPGEEPLEAAYREIEEETGLERRHLALLKTVEPPLFYELPPANRSSKTGRGQVQYWFVFGFHGDDKEITLGDKKEFRAWKWLPLNELAATVVPFKRGVYQELVRKLAISTAKTARTDSHPDP
jgi:putative (di)nucleoside polyphosphate hydrolase